MIANTLPKSLQDNPRLDQWITILPGGGVMLRVGKVEIGQGITTALAQIAAEELDIAPGRLVVTAGDTAAAPDEGTTTGSMSVEMSGGAVRLVCAEVRGLFLAAAAGRLERSVSGLSVRDGAVMAGAVATGLNYWNLAGAVPLAREATGAVSVKPQSAHRLVGTDMPRRDLALKLSGGGFLHDMVLPGMAHARVLHPPLIGARLEAVDAAVIERAGASVFQHGNFAAVLAGSAAVAEAALAVARPVWSGGAAIGPVMEEAGWLVGREAIHSHFGVAGEASPGDRIRAVYTRPYISHGTLGPSVAIAEFDGARLVIWSHSQGPYPLRRHVAALTGLAETAITVRHAQGAGCYGHNGADDAALEAALLALHHPGRPIRVLWTRADEFAQEPVGTAMSVEIAAALDAAGRPVDWTATIWSAPHVGRMFAANLLPFQALPEPPAAVAMVDPAPEGGGGASRNSVPIYDVGPCRVDVHLVQRPPVRTSALRGLGALPNVFAIESFLDELAERAGVDPVEYRLSILSDARARRVLVAAAEMARWARRGPAGTGAGLGIGLGRYKNKSAFAAVAVALEVDTEVRLRRIWCSVDAGLAINPDGIRNQVEGGIIQAASMTLKEQVRLGSEGIASRSWAEYPILRFSEIPPIETVLLDAGDEPPLGVGECTMGPTAAAIGNAVAHALGARIRDMPFTRERIAAALLAGG